MAGGFHILPATVQDGTAVPAASKVTANVRVTTALGPVSLASDVLTFPGPSTVGNWIVPNQRVSVTGVPTISQSAVGQAIVPGTPPVPSPTLISSADPRASGM